MSLKRYLQKNSDGKKSINKDFGKTENTTRRQHNNTWNQSCLADVKDITNTISKILHK